MILGIDPGTVVTGWGIIQEFNGNTIPIDFGCIRPNSKMKLTDRYLSLFEAMEELLNSYPLINAVACETPFVGKNIQSAIKLGMARNALILPAKKKKLPVFEYAPTKIKLAVTGTGKASKFQVQAMIQRLLDLKTLPEPEDAADALACAITHHHMARYHDILAGEI